MRARARLVLVLAAASSAVAALARVGTGPLSAPEVDGWRALEAWYAAVGAATAAIVALRLVALALAGWLVVAVALQLLGTLSARPALRRLADAVSPSALRRLVHGAAGLSLAVALAGPPRPSDPAGTAVMEVVEEEETTTTTTVPPAATTAPAPAAPAVPVAASPVPDEVVVAVGDSFWSLAVDAVADRPEPVPVEGYWLRLIAANRDRLVDPANADLLYPGQVLVRPAVDG
jgi:nucleoid-associated protein YgaU